jgi:hypothetical protein
VQRSAHLIMQAHSAMSCRLFDATFNTPRRDVVERRGMEVLPLPMSYGA